MAINNSRTFTVKSNMRQKDMDSQDNLSTINEMRIKEAVFCPTGESLIFNVSHSLICMINVSTFQLLCIHLTLDRDEGRGVEERETEENNIAKLGSIKNTHYLFNDTILYSGKSKKVQIVEFCEESSNLVRSCSLNLDQSHGDQSERRNEGSGGEVLSLVSVNMHGQDNRLKQILSPANSSVGSHSQRMGQLYDSDMIKSTLCGGEETSKMSRTKKTELDFSKIISLEELEKYYRSQDGLQPKFCYSLMLDTNGILSMFSLDLVLCYSHEFSKIQMNRILNTNGNMG